MTTQTKSTRWLLCSFCWVYCWKDNEDTIEYIHAEWHNLNRVLVCFFLLPFLFRIFFVAASLFLSLHLWFHHNFSLNRRTNSSAVDCILFYSLAKIYLNLEKSLGSYSLSCVVLESFEMVVLPQNGRRNDFAKSNEKFSFRIVFSFGRCLNAGRVCRWKKKFFTLTTCSPVHEIRKCLRFGYCSRISLVIWPMRAIPIQLNKMSLLKFLFRLKKIAWIT